MNQTVIRLYVMILVGIVVVAAGFLPRGGSRRAGILRALGVAALGTVFLLFGFHSAGAVERVVVTEGAAFVLERFPGRSWAESQWTRLDLADGSSGSVSVAPALTASPPGSDSEASDVAGALELPRSLKARLRRPHGEELGPVLKQAELVTSDSAWAVVAGYETIYVPQSVFLARFEADGTLRWRRDAGQLGLEGGRFRRAAPVPGTEDWIVVMTGWAKNQGFYDRLTHATHVVVARFHAGTGAIRWSSTF